MPLDRVVTLQLSSSHPSPHTILLPPSFSNTSTPNLLLPPSSFQHSKPILLLPSSSSHPPYSSPHFSTNCPLYYHVQLNSSVSLRPWVPLPQCPTMKQCYIIHHYHYEAVLHYTSLSLWSSATLYITITMKQCYTIHQCPHLPSRCLYLG